MCGIFGLYYLDHYHFVDKNIVINATDEMTHRGPDDSGYYVNNNIGLGHRRLSIIDLSPLGHQPMFNEDGQIVIVYNGEIYNYKEIQGDLIAKGHIFKSNCDTEVIIHAYEEWGYDCVQKFNGMFAFALWDNREKRMWVVRDRLGIKPLYYYFDDNKFICASEIKAILKTGYVKSELNENVLDAYFSMGYVPGPETMFRYIKKLTPGNYLVIQNSRMQQRQYWDFNEIPERETTLEAEIENISLLLEDCVKKRLMSDVPLGAFLSGGLDSSVVVGMMSKAVSDPVNTFTVAYHQGFSEKDYAQIVAERFKTNHNVFYLEPDDFHSSLQTLIHFAEEPIVEPAAIALYHLSKLAREKAIVLLSGEGSDEVFAGYYLYQFMRKIDTARSVIPGFIQSVISRTSSLAPKTKYQKYLDWLTLPLSTRYQGTSSYLTPTIKQKLYQPDFLNTKSEYLEEQFNSHFSKVQDKDPLTQMLYVDTKTWLVDDLLVKADKMTMAASIELRVPFLDYRLVEAATALPSNHKIKKGEGKFLVKKIAERFLPENIIYRKKMGFPVPTNDWFKGDLFTLIEDAITALKKEPWFNPCELDKIANSHRKGFQDHSKMLMTFLVFNEWRRQYA
jgi:asparagine synthase (glutamine-hydrolysing)